MKVDPGVLPDELRRRYFLDEPVACELLRAGFNDNYLVTAGDARFVLRLYLNDKYYIESADDFRFELDLLTHLKDRGISVAAPIAQRDGELLGSVESNGEHRWLALFPFAPGKPPKELNGAVVAALGDGVARMHLAADDFRSPHHRYALDRTYLLDEPVRLMAQVYERYGRGSLGDYEPHFARLGAILDALPRTPPAFGIIHGDLHGRNLHVDGTSFTLFDFDHGGYGWRAYDLATSKLGLGREFDAYLEAYAAVREPAKEELDAIPAFEVLRYLWDVGDILAMHAAWRKDIPEQACSEIESVLARVADP